MGLSRLNLYRGGAAALEAEVNCLAVMAKIRQNAKKCGGGGVDWLFVYFTMREHKKQGVCRVDRQSLR